MGTSTASSNARRRGRGISALVGAGFGFVWLLNGVLSAGMAETWPILLLTALLAGLSWQAFKLVRSAASGDRAGRRRVMRRFLWVNAVQLAAILTAGAVLLSMGQADALPAVISIIVAIHFLPLAGLFGEPGYFVLPIPMVLLDILALLIGGEKGAVLAMLATGGCLWAMSAIQLARGGNG